MHSKNVYKRSGKRAGTNALNEELLAQQDELQATLGIITDNEQKLTRRNELINGISSTLDKKEVLKSIVLNMSRLISANRGMNDGKSRKLSHEIMVIEDDFNLAELLKYELMDSGFHVSYLNIGGKAFQKLKTSSPDAIVLAILLEEGEMDVWTILRELKGSADLNEIPVFGSTALDEREKGISLGVNDKQGQFLVPQSFHEENKD
ncbi:hypothetical protein ACFX4I_17895 [Peribacillus sp. YIM B13472]|uniref:hypothetical protein n=1 Tax=Peribacillus sp. YIM B13472 TaxID=3366297 RepID=UPI0036700A9D